MKQYTFLLIAVICLILISCSTDKSTKNNVFDKALKNTIYSSKATSYFKALEKYEEDKRNEKIAKMKEKLDSENVDEIFPDFNFDEVIAYDYESEGASFGSEIIDNNKLAPFKKKVILSSKQIQNLITNLNEESTYGGTRAFCFNPHLGIVFYNKNKVVAYISICFECNYLVSSKLIPVTEKKITAIYDDLVVFADGFSEIGREKLSTLCRELDFSHCK